MIRKWQALKLKVPNSVLSMYLSILLLPADRFQEAENCMNKEIHKFIATDVNILIFHNYVKTMGIKNDNHVCVHDGLIKTNDGPESFHRHNKSKLSGPHPIVWKLIGNYRN